MMHSFRHHFALPQRTVYLDGNSLGPLTHASRGAVQKALDDEWAKGLITSWNHAGWMELPAHIGGRIARLIGADAHEVIVADSTSINLFKVLSAALTQQSKNPVAAHRKVILSESDNFPTDLYMVQGLNRLLGDRYELRLVDRANLQSAIDENIALVMLTQVDYRTGSKLDMEALTAHAHANGSLIIWDLAHSAGAFQVQLNQCRADFAVGCGYKYLNGGPGAPAFLYVADRHLANFTQPLSGWLGHASPFAFEQDYKKAPGILSAICGSPPILSMTALNAALNVFDELQAHGGLAALEAQSAVLCDAFIAALQDTPLHCITPAVAARRGSQVSFTLPDGQEAYAIVQALIAIHDDADQSVIGDFRAPNILRFGFAPLYNTIADVQFAAKKIKRILDQKLWQQPQFLKRNAVT